MLNEIHKNIDHKLFARAYLWFVVDEAEQVLLEKWMCLTCIKREVLESIMWIANR